MFGVAAWFIPKDLEKLFRYKVFKVLLSGNKITEDLIDMMMGWRHSGFDVYCGPRIHSVRRRPWRTRPGTSFMPSFPRRG